MNSHFSSVVEVKKKHACILASLDLSTDENRCLPPSSVFFQNTFLWSNQNDSFLRGIFHTARRDWLVQTKA